MQINKNCIKCGRALGGNKGDNQQAGVCYYCLQRKRCVKCGRTLSGDFASNVAIGLCEWCRRHGKRQA